nr:MAG TPA: hypothetical protein [Caudoviricetes sp.]
MYHLRQLDNQNAKRRTLFFFKNEFALVYKFEVC